MKNEKLVVPLVETRREAVGKWKAVRTALCTAYFILFS